MNLTSRLRVIERKSGLTGPCQSCHGRAGGRRVTIRGDEPVPELPCRHRGNLGPPAKIIRIVDRIEERTEGEAES